MPPRKGKAKAKKAESPEPLSIPGSSSYPGKNAERKGMDAPQWDACRKMLEGVYNTREDDVYIAEIFCQLPDKVDYADYYESIPEPECLDNVATLLSEQAFATPDKFFAQLLLIFLNAKHYNEEGSQLYEDADGFERQIWAEWRKYAEQGLWKAQPHLPKTQVKRAAKGKAGKAGSVDRTSAPPGSTPAPPTGAAQSPALPSVPEIPKVTLIAPCAATAKTTRSASGSGPGPADKVLPPDPASSVAKPPPPLPVAVQSVGGGVAASRRVSGTPQLPQTDSKPARPSPPAQAAPPAAPPSGPRRTSEQPRETRAHPAISGPAGHTPAPAAVAAPQSQSQQPKLPPHPAPAASASTSSSMRPLPQTQPLPVIAPTRSSQTPAATSSRAGPGLPVTPAQSQAQTQAQPYRPPLPAASNKTFGAMYGGQQAMDQVAYKEYLPLDTARLFDRDARQTVLWFSGPPLPSVQEPSQPTHSLAYLSYLAKRKRGDGMEDAAKRQVRS